MKTVQMTLDEELLKRVDELAKRLATTRSALARQALARMIGSYRERDLEAAHRAGYEAHPVRKGEFSAWEAEQAWGDEDETR
jgi:metal-responsive CopG/Arc/MetJ family transcriptional regulator